VITPPPPSAYSFSTTLASSFVNPKHPLHRRDKAQFFDGALNVEQRRKQ